MSKSQSPAPIHGLIRSMLGVVALLMLAVLGGQIGSLISLPRLGSFLGDPQAIWLVLSTWPDSNVLVVSTVLLLLSGEVDRRSIAPGWLSPVAAWIGRHPAWSVAVCVGFFLMLAASGLAANAATGLYLLIWIVGAMACLAIMHVGMRPAPWLCGC